MFEDEIDKELDILAQDGSDEFFYLDGGDKTDHAMHYGITGAVDIDQSIMAPIRKKYLRRK